LPHFYVQDRMRLSSDRIKNLLMAPETHIFICGRKGIETGVEEAFNDILKSSKSAWLSQREAMRAQGRFHVETY
jgi:benzoyl-CoA 2,3-dioxygenase component A